MNRLLALCSYMLLTLGVTNAQTPFYFTDDIEAVDVQQYGDLRPSVVTFEEGVGLMWSKPSGDLYYTSMIDSAGFSEPILLNAGVGDIFASNYGGADIAVGPDAIHVVFMTVPYLEAEVYWLSSNDGGLTWTDPTQLILPDSIIPFLPTISVNDAGEIAVMVMAYDASYSDPQYVVSRSFDGGATFEPIISLSEDAPHEVCDCCPAKVQVSDEHTLGFFRNNDLNIRDMWLARLSNAASMTDTVEDIDPTGWYIEGCPSMGPDVGTSGEEVEVVWISAASGMAQVLHSSVTPDPLSYESDYLFPNGLEQREPRIVVHGDTIGVAFQQIDYPATTCVIAFSLDGGQTFEGPFDIARDTASLFSGVDVELSNGGFDLVYRDLFERSIRYRRLEFGEPDATGMDEVEGNVRVFPNPASGHLSIIADNMTTVTLYDPIGRLTLQKEVRNSTLALDIADLHSGVYTLVVERQDEPQVIRRVVVQ